MTAPQTAQDVLTAAKVPFEAWPKEPPVAGLGLFQMAHVQQYQQAMLAAASHSSLLALLDQDLQDRFLERVGVPAVAESNRVLRACHERMHHEATAEGGTAKVLAIVGGAVMMIHCHKVQPFDVAAEILMQRISAEIWTLHMRTTSCLDDTNSQRPVRARVYRACYMWVGKATHAARVDT